MLAPSVKGIFFVRAEHFDWVRVKSTGREWSQSEGGNADQQKKVKSKSCAVFTDSGTYFIL
jgi:hypothetical protein